MKTIWVEIQPLKILVEGDAVLLNQYSVIAVNHKALSRMSRTTWPWNSPTGSQGPDAQQQIKDFKLLGKPLFTPNAKN